jgi:hypothetical protein
MSLSFVRMSCSSHPIPYSFPSHLSPNSRTAHFLICRYRRRQVYDSVSIHRGLFKVCTFAGASEFESMSQRNHDEEEDDEQQIRTRASSDEDDEVVDDDDEDEEEEEEGSISSFVFPERWDVLGLGQAMVISLFISYSCLRNIGSWQ